MAPLNCLGLLFLFVALVKSDTSLRQWESKDILRAKLENKLSDLRASENEVTEDKPQPKVGKLITANKPDYPVAFQGEEPACPNFNDIIHDLRTSVSHLTQLLNATVSIFTDSFNQPDNKCHLSLNFLSTIKCLVRAFAASYRQVTTVWTEAIEFRKDFSKMLVEYGQYSTKCNKNWTLGNTLQLVDLFKVVEGFIKDA